MTQYEALNGMANRAMLKARVEKHKDLKKFYLSAAEGFAKKASALTLEQAEMPAKRGSVNGRH